MAAILGGLSVYYVVCVLLFEEKDHHFGPFPSKTKQVVRLFKLPDGTTHEYTQPVTLFDRFRKLFGAYKIVEDKWFVNEGRMEMWSCPTCLSFWVAIIVAPWVCYTFSVPLLHVPVYALSFAGWSNFLYGVREAK